MKFSEIDKATVILYALMLGIPVDIGERTYVLSADNRLCVPGRNVTTGEAVLLTVNFGDFSLADFIALANAATDEEVIAIGANIVLNTK